MAELCFSDLMLEMCRTTDHVTSADALVYCIGSLKFLSGNSTALKKLHKRGCFEVLARILVNINKTVSTDSQSGRSVENRSSLLFWDSLSLDVPEQKQSTWCFNLTECRECENEGNFGTHSCATDRLPSQSG